MITKTCPYCGGDTLTVSSKYQWYYVTCEDCGSRGPMKLTRESAMSAFNVRSAVDEGEGAQ